MMNIKDHKIPLLYVMPTALLCLYFLIQSYGAPLHDFSNSYFSARLLHDGIPPETVIFDIHAFNSYIWELGYTEVLVDFYVNSPFTLAAFYPLAYISDPYLAKFIFNSISILLFIIGLLLLVTRTKHNSNWFLLAIPVLFYVPIRNQILFGQSYFIIFFFVVTAYYVLEKRKNYSPVFFLGFATLLKFFPVFYGIPLAFQKQWKTIGLCVMASFLFMILGIYITGYPLWESYFFDILPHTFSSNTTTDYRVNYQSLDVFFKSLFVADAYYNPSAWVANERLYALANWITKAIIIGSAIGLSFRKKKSAFTLLSIWVATLFLTQARTATYAQILWIIPVLVLFSQKRITLGYKIILLGIVFMICNLPFQKLGGFPVGIQFLRLWLVILLSLVLYKLVNGKFYLRPVLLAFVFLLPLYIGTLKGKKLDVSQYVLQEKSHFMIYDFFENNGKLQYKALGRNGDEMISTAIPVASFDTHSITIKDHQLYYGDRKLTQNISLKKKPVLVNNTTVYFLTDHHSRRGAFTLKSIPVNTRAQQID